MVGSGKFDGIESGIVGRWGNAAGDACPGRARRNVLSGDDLGRERKTVDKRIDLLFTAIDAGEAHGRIPMLFVRSLLLETHEALYVTIAVA